MLSPKHFTAPMSVRAHTSDPNPPSPTTDTTPDWSPMTSLGTVEESMVPSAYCTVAPPPQHWRLPTAVIAHEKLSPCAIENSCGLGAATAGGGVHTPTATDV